MDFKKIFIKDASPTKVGGQAVLEGIMMRGSKSSAVAIRLPDGTIHINKEANKPPSKLAKVPFIRGVFVFMASLVQGTKTLMYSAKILEEYEEEQEDDKMTLWLEKKFGQGNAFKIMMYFSVAIAVLFSVGLFMVGPTAAVNLLKNFTENEILLNLCEGLLRIIIFIIYVLAVSRMEDIKKVFQFHGAEHKCIHCYENGLELTPENCNKFETLHPRCGTSFLMFVMIISLILFSLLGWPNLLMRITSRILLVPVIAGISYELLKWAGKSDNIVVKVLSVPGLLLQKITTKEPTEEQLEVAICALKEVIEEGE